MTPWNSEKSLQAGCARQPSGLGSGATWFCRVLLGCFACVFLSPLVTAQDKNSSQTREPLAVFAGQPITKTSFHRPSRRNCGRCCSRYLG
jgi:hypothetical protein